MKKYGLLRSGNDILRVLEIRDNRVLVIDCIRRAMPVWVESISLETYCECTRDALCEVTGVAPADVDTLDAEQRKVMYGRYTMITPILAVVSDDQLRSRMICTVAADSGVCKRTIRNYLSVSVSGLYGYCSSGSKETGGGN